jgi:hypothetical protein
MIFLSLSLSLSLSFYASVSLHICFPFPPLIFLGLWDYFAVCRPVYVSPLKFT